MWRLISGTLTHHGAGAQMARVAASERTTLLHSCWTNKCLVTRVALIVILNYCAKKAEFWRFYQEFYQFRMTNMTVVGKRWKWSWPILQNNQPIIIHHYSWIYHVVCRTKMFSKIPWLPFRGILSRRHVLRIATLNRIQLQHNIKLRSWERDP